MKDLWYKPKAYKYQYKCKKRIKTLPRTSNMKGGVHINDDIIINDHECNICKKKIIDVCKKCQPQRSIPRPEKSKYYPPECYVMAGKCGHIFHKHCLYDHDSYSLQEKKCPDCNKSYEHIFSLLCTPEFILPNGMRFSSPKMIPPSGYQPVLLNKQQFNQSMRHVQFNDNDVEKRKKETQELIANGVWSNKNSYPIFIEKLKQYNKESQHKEYSNIIPKIVRMDSIKY